MKTKSIVRACLIFLMGITLGSIINECHTTMQVVELKQHIEVLETAIKKDAEIEVRNLATTKEEPETIPLAKDFDITTRYNCTSQELLNAIPEEHKISMYPLIGPIIGASKTYNINPLYLTSVVALESGWGSRESGRFNVAGWTTSDGGWRNFDNYYDCLSHVAKNLSTTYIDAVGSKLEAVCNRYCPATPEYTDAILHIMGDLEQAIVKERIMKWRT